ncbi:MAG: Serine/threonine protein kinase [Verrucomicrobiales bacterium]|nr:Serine/threonine protein kinase [Verrucomicrobiales bacterium]
MKSAFRKFALLGFAVSFCAGQIAAAANWPSWRGPEGTGIAPDEHPPLRWSANENVRWKAPLPDKGNSSPIVWQNRVFITQALEKEGRRTVMCFDRNNGKVLWQNGPIYKEPEESHPANPQCAASPVTDGERVIAFFGSAGIYCFDMDGKEVWRRDLGKHHHEWGYAASPIIHGDLCILNFGPGERQFMIGLNKKTGKTLWEKEIPQSKPIKRTDGFAGREKGGMIGSWSTPLIAKVNGRDELIMSFSDRLGAMDPGTGKELWTCDGLNPLIYASPLFGEGVAVGMGGFLGTTIAVKAGGQGDVTGTHRLWQTPRTKSRLGSGVIYKGHIYILNTEGIAECLELTTGKSIWTERVKGSGSKSESWSSMVLAGERIYISNQGGDTFVVKASPQFELLATNSIGDEMTNATSAISDGQVFIRTFKNLWCIGETKTASR